MILYCTLSTPKLNMESLLGAQIGLEDFIFAHVKGIQKEVTVCKSEDVLGLTITDNGVGYAFIKHIKAGSLMAAVPAVSVGDHIEEINGRSIVGWRHVDVARALRELEKGRPFSLRLVEPQKALDFQPPLGAGKSLDSGVAPGRGTLRLRPKGRATVEELPPEVDQKAIQKVDYFLELYLGIRDLELATTIFEAGKDKLNPDEFARALDDALGDFAFPDEFVFDVWGALGDAKEGRLH
ncbi:PDZ domain-containing protein GIPC2 isoform X2 [Monodelphis domestica]|uniref:PDZ domain-containing protein GIPC2 isoform X2 n=1 Tax=Monodelphis domestica TaxID=13616 RepID=UPI0024E27592|nr:PDZ domain-containing protein GIPC2 isoform X2 [Monodelphis domestica]